MVSPLFDRRNMKKDHTLEDAFRNLGSNMKKEYTLREAFVDFIIQYRELSMELQNSRTQYGKLMDTIHSKDGLINSKDGIINEQKKTIRMMNDRYKNDQKYINILIEKLCIHGDFSREYLESLRWEIESADHNDESEQREEMETPSVQQRPMPNDREDAVDRVQQEER